MTTLNFQELWKMLCEADESVMIEAKRGQRISRRFLRTVSAFSNEPGRGGGYLLFGVQRVKPSLFPEYEIVGVPGPNQFQDDFATQCRENLHPPIRPQITSERHKGKVVLVAFVPEASPMVKPVYIKAHGLPKGAYRRIGSTDQHCTDDDIALFYQERGQATYDMTPVPLASRADLDPSALERYRAERASVSPNAPELAYSETDLLNALAATTRHEGVECLTIAGLMLFGKESSLRRHFPMLRVDYIRVGGRRWVPDPERRYEAVEMRGSLLRLIPRLVNLVLDDVPKAFLLAEDQAPS